MNYKRTLIGDNIGFSTVIDEKFNTCSFFIRFITELKPESAADNSVAIGCLAYSNSKLTTLAEMNEQLSELYGSALGSFASKRGDLQILGLSSSWICSRFAIDGEDIDGRMLEIIRDCLFAPNVVDGGFDAETFKLTKNELIDRIESELNDKRSYALEQASKLAFRGEPAELDGSGSKEQAEAVTPESAYKAYLELLKTAQVEIMFVAPQDDPRVEEIMRESFAKIERSSSELTFKTPSPVKPEPEELREELDVRQCKLVMTFKSDSDDQTALKIMSTIFGGTPVSKLFVNVREKLSLCYYCACRFVPSKNTIVVDCGVERANIQKTVDEITNQLDEIRNGNITDEEMQSVILALDNSLTAVGDTPNSYSNWYFERFCAGTIRTPQEQFERYCEVTKERIIKAAASLKLDSTYYMLTKEADAQ